MTTSDDGYQNYHSSVLTTEVLCVKLIWWMKHQLITTDGFYLQNRKLFTKKKIHLKLMSIPTVLNIDINN